MFAIAGELSRIDCSLGRQLICFHPRPDFARLADLVDLVGIEPTTSSMPWKRAPSCATGPLCLQEAPCGKGQPIDSRLDGSLSQTAANLRDRRSSMEAARSEREHVAHVAGLGVARVQ